MENDVIKAAVKDQYGKVAQGDDTCGSLCGCTANAVGAGDQFRLFARGACDAARRGQSRRCRCGNPHAVAAIRPGESVLDLGSGAGFDCFLAADKVGPSGRVIGVDMTDAMLDKARANAVKSGFRNLEFRKGEMESLPVDNDSIYQHQHHRN